MNVLKKKQLVTKHDTMIVDLKYSMWPQSALTPEILDCNDVIEEADHQICYCILN